VPAENPSASARSRAPGVSFMGMSGFYGRADAEESSATIGRALDLGVTLLDSSDMYGSGHNEQS
jgi:aryl-alcohol dehydrogenase-like predicted oxidoreductase